MGRPRREGCAGGIRGRRRLAPLLLGELTHRQQLGLLCRLRRRRHCRPLAPPAASARVPAAPASPGLALDGEAPLALLALGGRQLLLLLEDPRRLSPLLRLQLRDRRPLLPRLPLLPLRLRAGVVPLRLRLLLLGLVPQRLFRVELGAGPRLLLAVALLLPEPARERVAVLLLLGPPLVLLRPPFRLDPSLLSGLAILPLAGANRRRCGGAARVLSGERVERAGRSSDAEETPPVCALVNQATRGRRARGARGRRRTPPKAAPPNAEISPRHVEGGSPPSGPSRVQTS